MRIRDAGRSDLPVIAELVRALAEYEHLTHQITWTEQQLGEALFGPGAVPKVLLAELDGRVVGVAIWFWTFSTFLGRRGIWVEDLFVLPEHRGKGAGTALMEHLFELAGDGRVEWSVLNWNTPSMEFYERIGAGPVEDWTVYRWRRDTGGER